MKEIKKPRWPIFIALFYLLLFIASHAFAIDAGGWSPKNDSVLFYAPTAFLAMPWTYFLVPIGFMGADVGINSILSLLILYGGAIINAFIIYYLLSWIHRFFYKKMTRSFDPPQS